MNSIEKGEIKQKCKLQIIRFLTTPNVVLTKRETLILTRWEFADLLMRQGILLTEILIEKITQKFLVSRFTADNDILDAMEVFGKSRKISRKYLAQLHLQDISADLARIRHALFQNKKVPNAKDLQALSKLHDSYTYQYHNLPDDTDAQPVGEIIMRFELPSKQSSMLH